MFCKHCGSNLPQNIKFCPNCGSTVNSTDSDPNKDGTTHTAPQPSNTETTKNTSSPDLTKDLKNSDLRLLSRSVKNLKILRGYCIFGLVLFGLLVISMIENLLLVEALVFAVLTVFFIWRTSKLTKAMRMRKELDARMEAAKREIKFN